MDCEIVKTVKDCEEMATMDAYDECEQISGWFECLNEVFGNIEKVKLFGEEVFFGGVDFSTDTDLIAICKKNRKKIKVTFDSIELIKPTKVQKLWLKAWCSWVSYN